MASTHGRHHRTEHPPYRARTGPRSHPVTHPLGAVRDDDGTPLRESVATTRTAPAALGAFHAARSRAAQRAARAARAQRAERRRQRLAARTGRR